jgi:S-adenosylhomocysteine hydrolase
MADKVQDTMPVMLKIYKKDFSKTKKIKTIKVAMNVLMHIQYYYLTLRRFQHL